MPAGLDRLAQLALRESVRAFENYILDFYLGGFSHFKGDSAPSRSFFDAFDKFYRGLLVACLLIKLGNFLRVSEELAVIEWSADFGVNLLEDFFVAVFLIALDPDLADDGLALEDVNDFDSLVHRFGGDADVIKVTGVEK